MIRGETITRHRWTSTTEDRYGNPIPGPDNSVAIPNVVIYPVEATELLAGQDVTITRHRLVFQGEVDILVTDEITLRGKRAAVDGQPVTFRNPYTGRVITQIDVKDVQ